MLLGRPGQCYISGGKEDQILEITILFRLLGPGPTCSALLLWDVRD
jgi:hypothetical protein